MRLTLVRMRGLETLAADWFAFISLSMQAALSRRAQRIWLNCVFVSLLALKLKKKKKSRVLCVFVVICTRVWFES